MKKSSYYKSDAHILSFNQASKIAVNTKYCCLNCKNIYPTSNLKKHTCKSCPICSTIIIGSVKKFCSKSCAAKFNNTQRTPAMRKKQSINIKLAQSLNPTLKNNFKNYIRPEKTFSRIQFHQCKECDTYILTKNWQTTVNKFCSSDCRTISHIKSKRHHHGHKKIYKYFNYHLQENVILESSWEFKIAKYLDFLKIIWIRPEPISWQDKNLKSHLYYADFYLPVYDVYLDPKNPYVMTLDKYKMSIIEQKVKIFYGSIDNLTKNINSLYWSAMGILKPQQ